MLRWARYAIVAVWIALLIALGRAQWGSPAAPAMRAVPQATPAVGETDEWTGLYMQDHKVGYAHSRVTQTADGYRLDETSVMRLTVMDREQDIRAVIGADTGRDWTVRRFTVQLTTDLGDFDVRGAVAGHTLTYSMSSGGETTDQHLELQEPIYLPSAARAALVAQGLSPGATTTLRVFDPSSLDAQPMTISVIGRDRLTMDGQAMEAWKLHESMHGIDSQVWLDDTGQTLREEGPMGLVTVRETPDAAVNSGWSGAPFDLMGAVAVPVRLPLADPRHLQHLRAHLSGIEGIAIPTDERQSLHDGLLAIDAEVAPASTYSLPYAGAAQRADLEATPFLQIEHPSVQAAAHEAVGDERDPLRAAQRVQAWVYDHLEKRPAATIPNAVQVLQTRAGDCNEHAVLYAALARAVGLPARVVAGVVYADGAFLYHAWDEVWLGERWVTVDPTFNQLPADATHIKLVVGGPDTHTALVPLIGHLGIDLIAPDAAG
jgi:hypothetical protein